MKRSSRWLSSRDLAKKIGVPYATLTKWHAKDKLLEPKLGLGGRRGGDGWTLHEAGIAQVVANLRSARVPVSFLRPIVKALRAWRGGTDFVAVYVAVCARASQDSPEKEVAFFRVESDGRLTDARQLSLF